MPVVLPGKSHLTQADNVLAVQRCIPVSCWIGTGNVEINALGVFLYTNLIKFAVC